MKVGSTFTPHGTDSVGTILSAVKTRRGMVYTWSYAHEPKAEWAGSDAELALIVGHAVS